MVAQHGPAFGVGEARVQGVGKGRELVESGCAEMVFGGGAQCVVVHVGGRSDPQQRIGGFAFGGGCRHLRAVAGQNLRQHIDRGVGVGGFRGQDAVRIVFCRRQIDVIFDAATGERDIEQLAGDVLSSDDVAAVPGGESLGAVDGGGVAECDLAGDIVCGQRDFAVGADMAHP